MNNTRKSINDVEVFSLSVTAVTLASHIIGIIMLNCAKSELSQSSILINLSVSEILYCLYRLTRPIRPLKAVRQSLNLFSTISNKMLMLTLLGDRFLEIHLNITYPIVVTRRRLFKVLGAIWVFGGIYGLIPRIVVATDKSLSIHIYYIHNYISLAFDSIVTITAVFTYGYFFQQIRKINRKDSNRGSTKNLARRMGRKFNFRIPFSIVATYLMFNVTSTILFQTKNYRKKEYTRLGLECSSCPLLAGAAYFLVVIGFLSDSILYVFMQRNVRQMFRRKIRPAINVNH